MNKKVYYNEFGDNSEYIVINPNEVIEKVLHDYNLDKETYSLFQSMHYDLFMYEQENYVKNIKSVLVSKFSDIGKYIIAHKENFLNDDLNITYEKVVNAYNIAVFTDDTDMQKEILPLFKNRIEGKKKELSSSVSMDTLNYISKNKSFNDYLSLLDNKDNNETYIVYEDGGYINKDFNNSNKVVEIKSRS